MSTITTSQTLSRFIENKTFEVKGGLFLDRQPIALDAVVPELQSTLE